MSRELQETYESHLEEIKGGFAEYYKARTDLDHDWRRRIGTLLLEYAQTHNTSLVSHVKRVSEDLQREPRSVYHMAQFAKKFPDPENVPFEPYTPWRDIVHNYLPEYKKPITETPQCKHCPLHCQ